MEEKDLNKDIIEIVEGDDEDKKFLESLNDLNEDEETEAEKEERLKNKNAEEARKRRELEAKEKAEKEAEAKRLEDERIAKEQEEAEKKAKELEEQEKKQEPGDGDDKDKNKVASDPKVQVKELVEKYPEIDLKELDNDKDFQEYLQGKWVKDGISITKIYENYVDFRTRLTKETKEEITKKFTKVSTPNLRGSSGGSGGDERLHDIYTKEELISLSQKMPFMHPKQYSAIEEKYERSIKHYKK